MIPILELATQYNTIGKELEEAVVRALRGSHYILGPEVQAFEGEFAAYNGAAHGIGVANGTDALHLAVRALDIKPGDEVICPSFTFMATAGAVSLAGATPVFADIDPKTYCLTAESVEKMITPRTRAVVVVHLYGNAAPMDELMALAARHNLAVIEDCAQAAGCTYNGKKVGTIGDFGCFSFFPSKNLGGIGDGGMVLSNKPELAEKVRKLRGHGSAKKYHHEILGTNSRLDEIQAAALRVKLKYLDQWNASRRKVAARYDELLADVVGVPTATPGAFHVYHQYTVRAPRQKELQAFLNENGVGSVIYYPICLHQQPLFAHLNVPAGSLPHTEKAQGEVLSLPMFPELSEEQIGKVSQVIHQFFGAPAVV